jgi:hypothetical protein
VKLPSYVATAAAGLLLASAAVGGEGRASAPQRDERLTLATPREATQRTLLGSTLGPLGDQAFGALPPPPDKVVLDPGYYGAVTVDHRAHLARRASCTLCHGPGPVSKIGRMPPARAHESCRGCHEQLGRGPIDCRGCHLAKASPVESTVAAAGAPAEPAAEADRAPAPAAPAPGAPALAFASPGLDPGRTTGLDELSADLAIRTSVHAGTTMLLAPGASGPAPGLLVGVTLRGEGYVASQTLEWAGATVGRGRAVGLLGGGIVLPVSRSSAATLEVIGGFDAREASFADVVPALGARAGIEWSGGRRWADSVRFSVTALQDVSPPRDAPTREVGSFTVSAGVFVGVDVAKLR